MVHLLSVFLLMNTTSIKYQFKHMSNKKWLLIWRSPQHIKLHIYSHQHIYKLPVYIQLENTTVKVRKILISLSVFFILSELFCARLYTIHIYGGVRPKGDTRPFQVTKPNRVVPPFKANSSTIESVFGYKEIEHNLQKCKCKHWMTTCLRSCDMNAIGDACKFTMMR